MTTIEKFEAWVTNAVPVSAQERNLFQGTDTKYIVPINLLPTELQRFYSHVRSYCLLPHYASTQDNLLLPSSMQEMTFEVLPGEPIYILSEHVDSWQIAITYDRVHGWYPSYKGASNGDEWKVVEYPIVDLLVCYVLTEVTFHSNLNLSKSHPLANQLSNPETLGGMWFEDAIEALRKSSSASERLFLFADQDLFPCFSRSGERIPSEFWYNSDTNFLWAGESFEETNSAVRLPLRSAVIDAPKSIRH